MKTLETLLFTDLMVGSTEPPDWQVHHILQ